MSALGFRVELEKLINRESRENGSNTPDFILAEYLAQCLVAFDHAVQARERHYGRPFHLLDKADARLLKHCNACGYTHWEGLPCPETKSAAVETSDCPHVGCTIAGEHTHETQGPQQP